MQLAGGLRRMHLASIVYLQRVHCIAVGQQSDLHRWHHVGPANFFLTKLCGLPRLRRSFSSRRRASSSRASCSSARRSLRRRASSSLARLAPVEERVLAQLGAHLGLLLRLLALELLPTQAIGEAGAQALQLGLLELGERLLLGLGALQLALGALLLLAQRALRLGAQIASLALGARQRLGGVALHGALPIAHRRLLGGAAARGLAARRGERRLALGLDLALARLRLLVDLVDGGVKHLRLARQLGAQARLLDRGGALGRLVLGLEARERRLHLAARRLVRELELVRGGPLADIGEHAALVGPLRRIVGEHVVDVEQRQHAEMLLGERHAALETLAHRPALERLVELHDLVDGGAVGATVLEAVERVANRDNVADLFAPPGEHTRLGVGHRILAALKLALLQQLKAQNHLPHKTKHCFHIAARHRFRLNVDAKVASRLLQHCEADRNVFQCDECRVEVDENIFE
jgi:hypothetical protein